MDYGNAGSILKRKFHQLDAGYSSAKSFKRLDHGLEHGLTVDESMPPLSDTGSLDQRTSRGTLSNGARVGDRFKDITYLSPFLSMQDDSFILQSCRSTLLRIPLETRRYLLGLFRAHYNAYIPLIPKVSLSLFDSQDLEDQDIGSLLTHLAMLAIGILHADSQRPDLKALRVTGTRESLLHQELKAFVEEHELQKYETERIAILLLLAELERCVGRAGTARLYLREIARLVEQPQQSQLDLSVTDEEILNRRSYMRACEFNRRQWALLDPSCEIRQESQPREAVTTQALTHMKSQARLPKKQSDAELSIYHAHLELLQLAEVAVQSLQRIPHGHVLASLWALAEGELRLSRWYESLPNWMRWQNRDTDPFPGPLYLLHQQYLAVLLVFSHRFEEHNREYTTISVQGEDVMQKLRDLRTRSLTNAVELAVMIAEYGKKFSLENAPVVLVYQIGISATSLVTSMTSQDSPPAEEMTDSFVRLNGLENALEKMSSTYKPAETISRMIKNHLVAAGIEVPSTEEPVIPRQNSAFASEHGDSLLDWCGDGSNTLEQDNSTAYLSIMSGEVETAAPSFPHRAPSASGAPSSQGLVAESGSAASNCTESNLPPSRKRDEGEERLVLVSDPVFCAYLDEMSYIVGHYGSPKDEQSSDRGSQKSPSNRSPGGIEQRRDGFEGDRHSVNSNGKRYQSISSDSSISLSRKGADQSILSPLVIHLRDISTPLKLG